jgi:hypothetical protein
VVAPLRLEDLRVRASWAISDVVRGFLVAHISVPEAARLSHPGAARDEIEAFLRDEALANPSLRGLMIFVYGNSNDAIGYVEVVRERTGELTWTIPMSTLGPLFGVSR